MSSYMNIEQIPVEAVRWFYHHGSSMRNIWKPFCGADSIKVEKAFRELQTDTATAPTSKIIVRGDLFEVDITTKMCSPIFWTGHKKSIHSRRCDWCSTPIQRGIWFNKINWVPLDFELAFIIEAEHVNCVIPTLSERIADKKVKRTLHKFSHGAFSVEWTSSGDVYLITRAANPFGNVKLHGGLSSVPINRGYHILADPNDGPIPITQLCFVVHGIGQQLASIRHECAKFRMTCKRIMRKRYPNLAQAGQRLEFIPVDWRSTLNLNFATLENITVGQMRPLRMYINNCFIDVLYYTSPVYRVEIMKSLSWELTRLFNLFMRNNPHFLQKGGQVSVLAHSLGTVIMHDILCASNQSLPLLSPALPCSEEDATASHVSAIAQNIEKARFDLLNMELQLMREISLDSPSSGSNGDSTFLSNIRKPQSWITLPQLSHLFMIGSPLGLFISLNSVPAKYHFSQQVSSSASVQPVVSTPHSKRRTRHHSHSERISTASPVETPEKEALDLGQTDPDVLIPYFACRRIYNIFHSYDPIAYRLEPLLLRHYSHVNPVVLPTVNSFFKEKHRRPSTASSSMRLGSSHPNSSSLADLSILESTNSHMNEEYESSTGTSEEESRMSEADYPRKLYKRLSITSDRQVYRQHDSRTFKIFSKLVTRRSSHVTTLGPPLHLQNSEPAETEKRLRYRVDYEWQKSFSPLAVLGAHHSYWNSRELAFFLLYQIFGHPDSVS
ncbi:unnamed protein product [Dicrocoelium dendriticum]|nr:unnamed protein product [Dicrocoelium dendriticum]